MLKKMYSVFDKKAQIYGTPFVTANENLALRSFSRVANDPTHDICLFPDDFTLVYLGEFDEDTGQITPVPHGQTIATASQFTKQGV
jgi:hypothetical protein